MQGQRVGRSAFLQHLHMTAGHALQGQGTLPALTWLQGSRECSGSKERAREWEGFLAQGGQANELGGDSAPHMLGAEESKRRIGLLCRQRYGLLGQVPVGEVRGQN